MVAFCAFAFEKNDFETSSVREYRSEMQDAYKLNIFKSFVI